MESLKFTGHSFQKKYLKISKSKKSEQYFRGQIEIFIRFFDEHFAGHFVILAGRRYHRFPWRHPPPPPRVSQIITFIMVSTLLHLWSIFITFMVDFYYVYG